MKILVKTRLSMIAAIENFFVKENGFQVIKNLISKEKAESSSTIKFVILDIGNSYTNISLFNKVNEEKLNVLKIDLSGDTSTAVINNCKTLLDFNKISIGIDTSNSGLFVIPDDAEDNKASISNNVWYKFVEYKGLPFPHFIVREKLDSFPESKTLHGSTAFAILDLNYSFCEEGDSTKRDLFSNIVVYASEAINDFFFAQIDDVVREFRDQDLSADIYNELVSPAYNKTIKKLRDKSDEITFVGLKSKENNIVWLPLQVVLQYLDMSSEIFYSCTDKLQNKKQVLSYEIPSLEQFTGKTVNYMEIRLEKENILFNFAIILKMQEPAFNVTKNKFEALSNYEFYQD